jgi:pre-mRNA-processing factor 6
MQGEKKLLEEGVEKFGDAPKLHMMLAQWHSTRGDMPASKRALQAGLRHCPRSVPLWLMLARLEEKLENVPGARALLEQVRCGIPSP